MGTFTLGTLCNGGQNIIGLVALNFKCGDTKGSYQLMQIRHLRPKLIRSLGAIGFVLREDLRAKGFTRDIKGNGYMRGPLTSEQGEQHRGKAINGICMLSASRSEVFSWKGVKGPICH